MTSMILEDYLAEFLKNEVAEKITLKNYDRRTKMLTYKNPQIVKGYIAPKISNADNLSEFPYICIRVLEVKNDKDPREHISKVKILFGTYCEGSIVNDELINDGSGYRDIWNIIEKTRQALLTERIIGKKFPLIWDDFKAEFPEEQPYPIWEGFIIVWFNIGFPEKNIEWGDKLYDR